MSQNVAQLPNENERQVRKMGVALLDCADGSEIWRGVLAEHLEVNPAQRDELVEWAISDEHSIIVGGGAAPLWKLVKLDVVSWQGVHGTLDMCRSELARIEVELHAVLDHIERGLEVSEKARVVHDLVDRTLYEMKTVLIGAGTAARLAEREAENGGAQ